jgi:hypothetical protein
MTLVSVQSSEKANATLQCPIQPGDYDIVESVDLPREIPRGQFFLLYIYFLSITCVHVSFCFLPALVG